MRGGCQRGEAEGSGPGERKRFILAEGKLKEYRERSVRDVKIFGSQCIRSVDRAVSIKRKRERSSENW